MNSARERFINAISSYSEDQHCAGWLHDIEATIRVAGKDWIGYAIAAGGWPTGYPPEEKPWDPVTPDEYRAYEKHAPGSVEYAIQVQWPDGCLFVTCGEPGASDRDIVTYRRYDDAVNAALIWKDGSTRIMARTVSPWVET